MKLFDLHCDTLYECYETGRRLRENDLAIDRAKTAHIAHYAQFFALFCGARDPDASDTRRCLLDLPAAARLDALLDTARREFEDNADWLTLCLCYEDMARAHAAGRAAAFLSIEGAELLETDAHIARAIDAGVRMVTLSWNYRSQYACGAAADNSAGLSARGKALVRTLTDRGVVVDVSHLSEAGFWDVCAQSEAPFAASHSNSRAVCGHVRNLTDPQFAEIVRRGGLVGLNLYVPFLRDDGGPVRPDAVLLHIEHFMALGGAHCLALGCDFDGCDRLPDGISGVRDMYRLAECMLAHNYSENTVNALFFDNADAFFARMLAREHLCAAK